MDRSTTPINLSKDDVNAAGILSSISTPSPSGTSRQPRHIRSSSLRRTSEKGDSRRMNTRSRSNSTVEMNNRSRSDSNVNLNELSRTNNPGLSGGNESENYEEWAHGQQEYFSALRDRGGGQSRMPVVNIPSKPKLEGPTVEHSSDTGEEPSVSQLSTAEPRRTGGTRERSPSLVPKEGFVDMVESQRGREGGRERERSFTAMASSSQRIGSPFLAGSPLPYAHKSQIRYRSESQASTPLASSMTLQMEEEKEPIIPKEEKEIKVKTESDFTPEPSSPGPERGSMTTTANQPSIIHTPVQSVLPPVPDFQPKNLASPGVNAPHHHYGTRAANRLRSESVSEDYSPSPQPLSLRKGLQRSTSITGIAMLQGDPQALTRQESQFTRLIESRGRSASPAPSPAKVKKEKDEDEFSPSIPLQPIQDQTQPLNRDREQVEMEIDLERHLQRVKAGEIALDERLYNYIKNLSRSIQAPPPPPLKGAVPPAPPAFSASKKDVFYTGVRNEHVKQEDGNRVKGDDQDNIGIKFDVKTEDEDSRDEYELGNQERAIVSPPRNPILISPDLSPEKQASPPVSVASSVENAKAVKRSTVSCNSDTEEKGFVKGTSRDQSLEELPGKRSSKLFMPRSSSSEDVGRGRKFDREETNEEIEAMLLPKKAVSPMKSDLSIHFESKKDMLMSPASKEEDVAPTVDNGETNNPTEPAASTKDDETMQRDEPIPSRLSSNSPSYIADEGEYRADPDTQWLKHDLGASPPSMRSESPASSRLSSQTSDSLERHSRASISAEKARSLSSALTPGLQDDIAKWSVSPPPREEQPDNGEGAARAGVKAEQDEVPIQRSTPTPLSFSGAFGADTVAREPPTGRSTDKDSAAPRVITEPPAHILMRRSSQRAPPKALILASEPQVEAVASEERCSTQSATSGYGIYSPNEPLASQEASHKIQVTIFEPDRSRHPDAIKPDSTHCPREVTKKPDGEPQKDITVSVKLPSLLSDGTGVAKRSGTEAMSRRALPYHVPDWLEGVLASPPIPEKTAPAPATVTSLQSVSKQTTTTPQPAPSRPPAMISADLSPAHLTIGGSEQLYEMTCPRCQDCGSTAIANLEHYGKCAIVNPATQALPRAVQSQPRSILKQVMPRRAEKEPAYSESESSLTSEASSEESYEAKKPDLSEVQDDNILDRSHQPLLERIDPSAVKHLLTHYTYQRPVQDPAEDRFNQSQQAIPGQATQKRVRIVSPEKARQLSSRKLVSSVHEKARSIPEKRVKAEPRQTLSQKVDQAIRARPKPAIKHASVLSDLPSTGTFAKSASEQVYNMSDLPSTVRASSRAAVYNRVPGQAQRSALGEVAEILAQSYMADLKGRTNGGKRIQSASGPSRIANSMHASVPTAVASQTLQGGTLVARNKPTRQAVNQSDKGRREVKPSATMHSVARVPSTRRAMLRAEYAESEMSDEDAFDNEENFDDETEVVAASAPAKTSQSTNRATAKHTPLKKPAAQTATGSITRKRRTRSDETIEAKLQQEIPAKRMKVEEPSAATRQQYNPAERPLPAKAGQKPQPTRNARLAKTGPSAPVSDKMQEPPGPHPRITKKQLQLIQPSGDEQTANKKVTKVAPMPLPGKVKAKSTAQPIPKAQAAQASRRPQPPSRQEFEEGVDLAQYFDSENDEELEAELERPIPANYRFPKTQGKRPIAPGTARFSSQSEPRQPNQTATRGRRGLGKFTYEAEVSEEEENIYGDNELMAEGEAPYFVEGEEETIPTARARKSDVRGQTKAVPPRSAKTPAQPKKAPKYTAKPRAPPRGKTRTVVSEEEEEEAEEGCEVYDEEEDRSEEEVLPVKKTRARTTPAITRSQTGVAATTTRRRGRGRGK